MISSSNRDQIENILRRIATGAEISFNERILIDNFADGDQTVANWLKRAQRVRLGENQTSNQIDLLLKNLDLGSPDPDTSYKPEEDDLGEWFCGAPSWLGRS